MKSMNAVTVVGGGEERPRPKVGRDPGRRRPFLCPFLAHIIISIHSSADSVFLRTTSRNSNDPRAAPASPRPPPGVTMAGPPGGQQHTPQAFLTRTEDAAGPRSAPAAAGEPAGLGGAEGFPPPRHAPGGVGGGVPPEAEGLQARVAALQAEERALRAPLASEADAVAALRRRRFEASNAARMLNAEAEGLRARARQLDFQASSLAHQLEEKEALLLQEKAQAERKGEEVAGPGRVLLLEIV